MEKPTKFNSKIIIFFFQTSFTQDEQMAHNLKMENLVAIKTL